MKFIWPCEHIWELISPMWPHFSIEVLKQTDSTNTQLLQRIRQGQTAPTLLVAEHQTAGRGRAGRSWASTAQDSLTFSLSAPMPENGAQGLSLAIGCAIAQTLDPKGQTLKIKWPNDIWGMPPAHQQWHKIAGILIETVTYHKQRYAVIGIGINISPPPLQSSASIPCAGLAQMSLASSATYTLKCIAPQLAQAVYNFKSHGLMPWMEIFKQRDLLANTPLYTSKGLKGIGAGIDPQGTLWVNTSQGALPIYSGEVSIRPCSGI